MCPDEGLATSVVKVALHEKIEQMGCVAANGAQLGVATFQNLIAESSTHVCTPFKKRARELRGQEDKNQSVAYVVLSWVNKRRKVIK